MPYKKKLFGLTIPPMRLAKIRAERRPGSQYAAPVNCPVEIAVAETMMRQSGVRRLFSALQVDQRNRPHHLARNQAVEWLKSPKSDAPLETRRMLGTFRAFRALLSTMIVSQSSDTIG